MVCWGLPFDRLTAPRQAFAGIVGRSEKHFLGHAVVLENTPRIHARLERHRKIFAAAICVPISSPTTILGTLRGYVMKPAISPIGRRISSKSWRAKSHPICALAPARLQITVSRSRSYFTGAEKAAL